MKNYETDVVIAGGGLAGIVAAEELLSRGLRVLLVDKDRPENFGGLAKQSAGGVLLIDSPHQRKSVIEDSPELAWQDWQRVAHYEATDQWPRQWGEFFCHNSREYVFEFLHHCKVRFLSVVNWAERGLDTPGNTVPRWHMTFGLGLELIRRLLNALDAHQRRANLTTLFDTEVNGFETTNGRVTGIRGQSVAGQNEVRVTADHVVVASGGICGGDLSRVRANWYADWGPPPATLLNGAHHFGDGMLHDRASELGAALTHLDLQWHYATGIHNPAKRRPADGLSLVPPRSALWLNARGERIMSPGPMLAYGDTRELVATVLKQPGQYSWLVLNWKIAIRELAVSGPDYLTALREKSWIGLLAMLLFGNRRDVRRLLADCPDDIVVANDLETLMDGMAERSLCGIELDRDRMQSTIHAWDDLIERGPAFRDDDQLRRIARSRAYRGDRMRTCDFQTILDPRARPLIAIRQFVLARKSLGGLQTDLECRVLGVADGAPIPGLYAIGEAAGFGGGGIHGRGSLEGSFLASCILTGRVAARAIG